MARIHYEVTARVHEDLAARFSSFMTEKHIRDVLQTGTFLGASFDRFSPTVFRVSYEAASAADLDRYLAQHATRLRADVDAHFPAGIEISRETWTRVGEFESARE